MTPAFARAAASRAAAYFAFWLMIAGVGPGDLLVGVLAAGLATGISLSLLPPGSHALSPLGIARLAWRFPGQSLAAGVDVASRVFDARMPLMPGIVTVPVTLPPGTGRDAFCAFMSLLPGTVPIGDDGHGGLIVHCLDIDQPIAEQFAREEELFRRAIGLA